MLNTRLKSCLSFAILAIGYLLLSEPEPLLSIVFHTTNLPDPFTVMEQQSGFLVYNSDQLKSLNHTSAISRSLLRTLRELHVIKKSCKQTKRGCRGGRKREQGKVTFASHPRKRNMNLNKTKGSNLSNLIPISCDETPSRPSRIVSKQDPANFTKVVYMNAQSARNKTVELCDVWLDSKADIAIITETWLKPRGDEAIIQALTHIGFEKPLTLSREEKSGGGIAFL